jgi:hypothetical protein
MGKKSRSKNDSSQPTNQQGNDMTDTNEQDQAQGQAPEGATEDQTSTVSSQDPETNVGADVSISSTDQFAFTPSEPKQETVASTETTEAAQPTTETTQLGQTLTPLINIVTPAATPTTAVDKPLPKPTNETSSEFVNKTEHLKASGTSVERSIISRLEKYVTEMAPGVPKTPEQIVAAQRSLWFAIKTTLEKDHVEFNSCFSIILDFFKAYEKGAFGDRHVYRGAEFLPLPKDEIDAFHQIVNLIKITCESKSRAHVLQQVSLERTLAKYFTEPARQKLIAYYQA